MPVLLVDAMAYIFRAYYSSPESRTSDGRANNACFGFTDFLIRLINREEPSHMAVVFDSGPLTFRNEIYPDYKANRSETPADLVQQFEPCFELAQALGLRSVRLPNFEADDVLATLTEKCVAGERDVLIISGDKDLAQLVTDRVSVRDPGRNRRFTVRTVPKRFGVRPDQMVDYLALTGDASDNIPGVRGVGPKTAAPLLETLDSLDGIFANLERVGELPIRGAKSLAAKLEQGRSDAYLSQKLINLRRDLPLELDLHDLTWTGARRETCESLFADWGLSNMIPFVPRWREKGSENLNLFGGGE
ncbi:MAG: hypothetical protein GY835_12410 [bacterium]|nr:hypothetical protein [bacterium]